MYEARHAPLASRRRFIRRIVTHVVIVTAVIALSLGVGIGGYRYFEGMDWIDAYLNAAMLLGGMGPVGPELRTRGGKLFAGAYALYAGMVVLVAAGILMAPVFHRVMHRFHLEEEKERDAKRVRSR
jgi:hypothetical protein